MKPFFSPYAAFKSTSNLLKKLTTGSLLTLAMLPSFAKAAPSQVEAFFRETKRPENFLQEAKDIASFSNKATSYALTTPLAGKNTSLLDLSTAAVSTTKRFTGDVLTNPISSVADFKKWIQKHPIQASVVLPLLTTGAAYAIGTAGLTASTQFASNMAFTIFKKSLINHSLKVAYPYLLTPINHLFHKLFPSFPQFNNTQAIKESYKLLSLKEINKSISSTINYEVTPLFFKAISPILGNLVGESASYFSSLISSAFYLTNINHLGDFFDATSDLSDWASAHKAMNDTGNLKEFFMHYIGRGYLKKWLATYVVNPLFDR